MSLEPFLDKIPLWLALSLVLGVSIFASLPKVFDTWQKANAYNRWYERKKKRLELLKMHYDIEALKKEKGLATLPGDSENLRLELEAFQQKVDAAQTNSQNFETYPLYGVLGGIVGLAVSVLVIVFLPGLRQFYSSESSDTQTSAFQVVFTWVGLIVLSGVLGSVYASSLPLRFRNKLNSFTVGFLIIMVSISLGIFL